MSRLILLSAVTVLSFTGYAQTTANLWVDTNGGSCSRQSSPGVYIDAQACSSMQAAQTAASAGDTIIIKNGTYGAQNLNSSAKTSMVYFYAETDGSVLVSGLSISIDKVTVKGVIASGVGNSRGTLSLTSSGTGTVVDGFRARRIWISGNHITVKNGEFCDGSGSSSQEEDCVQVWNGSSYISFIGNSFHDWHGDYDVKYHNDMIQFYPSGSRIIIDGNKFYNGPTSNIMTGGGVLTDWVIQNNYFGAPYWGGNNIVFGNSSSPCSGLVYRNNVDASGLGINNVDCSNLSPDISGNIYTQPVGAVLLYGPVSGGYNIFVPSGGVTAGSNAKRCNVSWEAGSSPTAGGVPNVHLASNDTCAVGAGNPASFPSKDIDGQTRTSPPDAGADQRSGSGSPVPEAPTALRISVSRL